jgi:hypothetical protein
MITPVTVHSILNFTATPEVLFVSICNIKGRPVEMLSSLFLSLCQYMFINFLSSESGIKTFIPMLGTVFALEQRCLNLNIRQDVALVFLIYFSFDRSKAASRQGGGDIQF